MRNTDTNRFIFSAYANSIAASLHKPLKAFMTNGPSAALPVVGGYVHDVKENLSFKTESVEILRVGRATSTVFGEQRGDDRYITLATTTVEKLNILDVVTADVIVGKLNAIYTATKRQADEDENESSPSEFSFAGSHFENLKIDGKTIHCYSESSAEEKPLTITRTQTEQRYLCSEICEEKNPCRSEIFTSRKPHREFYIPHFGTIHLGEIDVHSSRVTLTMLRFELGCVNGGKGACNTQSTNGHEGTK